MIAAEVEALSDAVRGLRGECGLSFLRFALNAWAAGHRLHTAEVPSCLAGYGPGSANTRAFCGLLASPRVDRHILRLPHDAHSRVPRVSSSSADKGGCAESLPGGRAG